MVANSIDFFLRLIELLLLQMSNLLTTGIKTKPPSVIISWGLLSI